MKITRVKGEGQSQCKRCKERGKWNVQMKLEYKTLLIAESEVNNG